MKKKFFLYSLVCALPLLAIGCNGIINTNPKTNTATESSSLEFSQDNWYEEVLKDNDIKEKYPYCRVLDINLDGVDELFLSTTEKSFIGNDQKACIMAFENGEIRTLQEIGGAGGEYWLANKIDATLSYVSRLSGEKHLSLYKYDDGSFAEISSSDIYAPHHYAPDNQKTVYLIEKKKVSKEECESYWEQYGNKAGAITFEKY